MLEVVIGIIIFAFILLGAREGLVKSLASTALVFFSLFLATYVIESLTKNSPQYSDPNFSGTIILFFIIWIVSFIVTDILLTILLRKVIKVVVLGPIDMAGGLVVGGFKGLLISSIVFQLALALPFSAPNKKAILDSTFVGVSFQAYQWAYPYVRQVTPKLGKLGVVMNTNLMEEIAQQEKYSTKEKKLTVGKLIEGIPTYSGAGTSREAVMYEIFKKYELLPPAPPSLPAPKIKK